ncbi:MAG: hypothetical protein AAFQ94_01915 [Bacteroidota bacterium]
MTRKLVYIFIIVLLTGGSFSSQGSTVMDGGTDTKSIKALKLILSSNQNTEYSIVEFTELLESIKEKKDKFSTEQQYLQFVYKYVHRKRLKRYKTYVTLGETLSRSGYYDCLTGTLLYSLILEELGFQVTIREFNYHVMLIVNLDDKKILIESTDPLNGFVVGDEAVNQRIAEYKADDLKKKRQSVYGFTKLIDNEITTGQLVGLHFYNQAINSLNQLDVKAAKVAITKAESLYPSQRVHEIKKFISGTEVQSLIASID